MLINQYVFDQNFENYRDYFNRNNPEKSFNSESFETIEEKYKYDIYDEARKRLAFENWNEEDVGNGKIVDKVISSIEIERTNERDGNNLVEWDSRRGQKNCSHQPFYDAKESPVQLNKLESCLYRLYKHDNGENKQLFNELIEILGKQYPL